MTRIHLAAVFVIVALPLPVFAQTSISASAGPDLASFAGTDGVAQQVSASVSLEHLANSARVRLFYDFDTGDYAGPGSWRFLSHSGGGSYRFDLGAAKTHHAYVGGDATVRRNGDSWSAASFNAVGTFVNFELHPGVATVRTGYRLDVRRFSSLRALDQSQHTGFGSVLVSFATRTTIIGEAFAGAKNYAAVSPATQVIVVPVSPPLTSHSPRQGRWGAMTNAALLPVVSAGAPGSTARQVTVFGRVAQSLATRTALSFEFSRRTVSGEISSALVTTPVSFFDDGIYDDLFASDALRRAVMLKSIVGSATEVAASVTWLNKDYPATPAFDESGIVMDGVLRSDRVMQIQLDGVFPLFERRTGPVSLDLVTGYQYARHRSTSALYRYSGHTIRLAFGITY